MKMFNSCLAIGILGFFVLPDANVRAQISTDSLINHSLNYVDYPPFVRHGESPPMKPRLVRK
jgi:hypothetical protein